MVSNRLIIRRRNKNKPLIRFSQIIFPVCFTFILGATVVTFTLLIFSSPAFANVIVSSKKIRLINVLKNIKFSPISFKLKFGVNTYSFISDPIIIPINFGCTKQSLILRKFKINDLLIYSNRLRQIKNSKLSFGTGIVTLFGFQIIGKGLGFTGNYLYTRTTKSYSFVKNHAKNLYSSLKLRTQKLSSRKQKTFCSTALGDPDLHSLLSELMDLEKLSSNDFNLGSNLSANLLFEGGFFENDGYDFESPKDKRRKKRFAEQIYNKSKILLSNPIAFKTFFLTLGLFFFFLSKKFLFPKFDFVKFLQNVFECLKDPEVIDRYVEAQKLMSLCKELKDKAKECLNDLTNCTKERINNVEEFQDQYARTHKLAKDAINDIKSQYDKCRAQNIQYVEHHEFWDKIYTETGMELAKCKNELDSYIQGQNGKN